MANLVAQFTSSIRTGVAPLAVNFTNTSTGPYTSVRWDFGDSQQSSLINPSHQFISDGVYQVTLTIFDVSSGQDQTNTTITVFVDNDDASATTQQALFTSKRFTAGQVAVRKTVTDGSTVETEFPLSAGTGDFNLEIPGSLIIPLTATTLDAASPRVDYTLMISGVTYGELYNYDTAKLDISLGLFMATGDTGADSSCSGHQLFMYNVVSGVQISHWTTVDRKLPLISGDTATLFRGVAIISCTQSQTSGSYGTGNTLNPDSLYKSIQVAPTIDSLESLDIPNMYEPASRAAGLFQYFEEDGASGVTKLFIQPTYSGWDTVEMWKPSTVRLDLPFILWHSRTTAGVSLVDSTTTYRDAETNLKYGKLTIENEGSYVGRVFYEKKMIVIDDLELQAALNYLSNRSYTLPTPSVATTSTVDAAGGLQSGITYFVTYRMRDNAADDYGGGSRFGNGLIQPLHCRNIQTLTPTISGNKFRLQAAESEWYTTNRTSNSDEGFTAAQVDVIIGSATTTDMSTATWYYSGSVATPAQLLAGIELQYEDGAMPVATFGDLTISGSSDWAFGDDQTVFGYFSATSQSTIYKMSTTCVAKNTEFNVTQNDTFDESLNESVYISEVALYNEKNELLMTGKLNRPIEKNDKKFVTIKMELDL